MAYPKLLGGILALIILGVIAWYIFKYRERKLNKVIKEIPKDYDISNLPQKPMTLEELKSELANNEKKVS